MTEVLLVRHATHDLVDKALAGRMPGVALSQRGTQDAERLSQHLAGRALARVLASPVQRAWETAEILARPHGLKVELATEIEEIDCGAWTGASFDSLHGDADWDRWNAQRASAGIPGGETMAAVQARAAVLLDRIAEEGGGPVALVSHSDVIKALVIRLLGMSLDQYDRIVIDPASVTTLNLWGPNAGAVVRLNETAAP